MAGARTTKARSAHAAPVDHLGTHSPRDSAEYRYNVRLGDSHSDSRNRRNARVLPSTRRPVLARRCSVQRTVKKAYGLQAAGVIYSDAAIKKHGVRGFARI